MIRFALAVVALGASLTTGLAHEPAEGEDSRYTFHRTEDGFLRLDARTGQVQLCKKGAIGWACRAVPDERAALEGEIARLQGDNAALKKELVSRGLSLPGGAPAEPPVARMPEEPRPPKGPEVEREMERMMAFIETVWRRLVEMIVTLQKDVLKKS
jgi:hypothetical protein